MEKVIEKLKKRKAFLTKERENRLLSARSLELVGFHSVADDDRKKAHNLLCRISEIDLMLSVLEK